MMLFVVNIKKEIPDKTIKEFLKILFNLKEAEVDILTGNNKNAVVRYESKTRAIPTEFNCEIAFYVPEILCLTSEVYNELQLALPLSGLIDNEVVIHEQSNDPYRWILIKSPNSIFIVDEIINDGTAEGRFEINRNRLRPITIEKALSVLPSRRYIEMPPENRPIFFNQNQNWDKE